MRRLGIGVLRWPTQERHRRPLRQLFWSVGLVTVGLAIGVAAGQPFASRPVGQATVLVNPLPGNAFSARSVNELVDLKTEAQLAFSDGVLGKVRSLTGARLDPVALRRRVSVRVASSDAEVIVVLYRGETSVEATRMATQVANRFLEVRTENAKAAAVTRGSIARTALDKTQHDFDTATATAGTDPAALTVLAQRINALQRDLRAVSGDPPSPGMVLAASAPRSAQVRKLRIALLVTSVLLTALIGIRLGSRPRHLPRWTRRLRLRRPRFRRPRFSLRSPRQAQAR
jgi:hypothetical protein